MTFWFCYGCKKTWHTYVQTPASVKRIRCFYCLKTTSVRLKDDKHTAELRYGDYDIDMRGFKKIARNRAAPKA